MLELKSSRWAGEIIALQSEEGNWGYFHTLSNPAKSHPITTEQALRRLQILGYTIDDSPVKKAVSYMHDCLAGNNKIPDRREKLHNWDIYTSLMLSTWIRRFTLEDIQANNVAEKWAEIISYAFRNGAYNHNDYVNAYIRTFKIAPRGGRLVDFVSFYPVSMIANLLEKETEEAMFDYIIQHESGIYYIYSESLLVLPPEFKSKQASRYIAAMELLSEYKNPACKERLNFVVTWLNQNKGPDGLWDMGSTVKDGVRFPLSDSWRSVEARKLDCTYRISNLIKNIGLSIPILS